jgi:hypothetical protein
LLMLVPLVILASLPTLHGPWQEPFVKPPSPSGLA